MSGCKTNMGLKMNLEDAEDFAELRRAERERRDAEDFAELRRNALTRFALDFLKANLDALESDGLLDGFGPVPNEEEVEKLKDFLGVKFF